MKVSPKRIDDGSKSISIGNSGEGHALRLRCDYLAIVSEMHSLAEKQFMTERFKTLRNSDRRYCVRQHFSKKSNGKKSSRYREIITIREKYADAPVLLWIGYGAVNKGAGDIRFDFRPQHLTNVGLNRLLLWLAAEQNFGPLMFSLLERAWVTRVDAALDVYEFDLDEAYFSLKGSHKAEYREFPDGGREICLGSRTSPLHIVCYPKVDAQDKRLPKPDSEGRVTVNMFKMPLFTRFEARKHIKQKYELKLRDLQTILNPFDGLEFYNLSLADDLDKYPEFAALFEKWPLPRAKSEFKKIVGKNTFQKFKRELLQPHLKVDFLDKQAMWANWPVCVHNLGLLGQSAYWLKKHRDRLETRGNNILTV